MPNTSIRDRRDRFRRLHERGLFVMPNPWDIGSARILVSMGFDALATTSLGHAAGLGKLDLTVTRQDMLDHVAALTAGYRPPAQRGCPAPVRR
jgi:methylisocitrate lyase